MDRDFIVTVFRNVKNLSEKSAQKKGLLKKNRVAIADSDGNIPEKYQRAFSKLAEENSKLEKQLDSGEVVLLKVVQAYVKENAMGNLVFEKNNDGTQYFEDVYTELLDKNFALITKAIDAFDLKKIDDIVQVMRDEFLTRTFSKYREYAKTLSFNK